MRLPRLTVALIFLGLVPGGAGSAAALDLGQWIPGLRLTPFFAERVVYETNVFQVPSGAQADIIFKTIPGFLADFTFGPHSASLGYRAEILNYVTLTSQDTVNHIGVAQLRLDFPRLFFNLRDDFTHTSDPPNTELTGPIESDTNVLVPEAEYRITSRLSAGVNYAWTHVSFADPTVASRPRSERAAHRRVGVLEGLAQDRPPAQLQLRDQDLPLPGRPGRHAAAAPRVGPGRGHRQARRRRSASGSSGASPTRRFSRAMSD